MPPLQGLLTVFVGARFIAPVLFITFDITTINAYNVGIIRMSQPLGEFEQLVLLAVLRLKDGAYAVPIRQEIENRTHRDAARGAVYITLDRLEEKGYLRSYLSDGTPERGGRPRRYYHVTTAGVHALEESWVALRSMWKGLKPKVGRT
jgi:PadR family transcriptional regulator PadR